MAKKSIHIKKSKRGTLHDAVGVDRDKKIPASKLKIHEGDSPALKKKKQFAINAKKWNHAQDGAQLSYTDYMDQGIHPFPLMSAFQKQQQTGIPTEQQNPLQQSINPQSLYKEQPHPIISPTQFKQQPNWGKIQQGAVTALSLVDMMLPQEQIKRPVVRPQTSYNPLQYGTGSSAIAEDGITISNDGYKRNSKDRKKKSLIIPSGNITMKGVPHDVLGTDNTGYQQLMTPGNDYQFPGDYVHEIPMAKKGKKMKKAPGQYISKSYQDGGNLPRMTPEQIDYFNGFIEHVKKQGLQGSKKLNSGTLNQELYKQYQQANPSVNLPLVDLTKMAQNEQHLQKDFDVNFAKRKLPNAADSIAKASISPLDGFFGSETSLRPIPQAVLKTNVNGQLVNQQNLGYVPNSLNAPAPKKAIPAGVTVQKLADGDYYEDPQTGDLVKVNMKNGGHLSAYKAEEMLHDGTAHGKPLTAKQKRYFGMIAHPKKAQNGLQIENNQFEPMSSNTLMLEGPSHENGGIDIAYQGQRVEAEGGEPIAIMPDESAVVFGNLKNPLTGNKFKHDAKMISKKIGKAEKIQDMGSTLVNTMDPHDKWQSLKFNAGNAMMIGGKMKSEELLSSLEHLSDVEEATRALKFEGKDEAKNGLKMYAQRGITLDGKQVTYKKWKQYQDSLNQPLDTQPLTNSIAQRHNNPGNIKFGDFAKKYGAVAGSPDKITGDNSSYAQFPTLEAGMEAMKGLLQTKSYRNLTVQQAASRWTGGSPYKNIPASIANKKISELGPQEFTTALDAFTLGEDSKKYNWEGVNNPPGNQRTLSPQTPYQAPGISNIMPQFPQTPVNQRTIQPSNYDLSINPLKQYNVPTDAEPLQFNQVVPELYAAATNQQDPVWLQQYQPDLFSPYQVDFQERRNQVNQIGAASRNTKALSRNPAAQAALNAQAYDANSNINAEEFRINQGIANDITNKNVALINEAKLKNLGLADLQYTRQSTAKSKTKAVNQEIVNSLTSKIAQNKLENRTLQTYENLYPHFRYDQNYQLQKEGAPGQEYLSLPDFGTDNPLLNSSTSRVYDKNNTLKSTTVSTPTSIKQKLDEAKLKNLEYTNMQQFLNKSKGKFAPKFAPIKY